MLKSTGSVLRSSRRQLVRWSGACWRSGNPRRVWGQESPSHHFSSLQSLLPGGLEPFFPLPFLLRGHLGHTTFPFLSPLQGCLEHPFSPPLPSHPHSWIAGSSLPFSSLHCR
ncbi:hypothetical protein AOLI_G00005770 [Acnodon oligacanthus]